MNKSQLKIERFSMMSQSIVTCCRCHRKRYTNQCVYILNQGFQCDPDSYPEYSNEKKHCFVCKHEIDDIPLFIETLCGEGTIWVCSGECLNTDLCKEQQQRIMNIVKHENDILK